MQTCLKEFCADKRGATAIEYAFIASLIGIAIVGSLSGIGIGLNGIFSNAKNSL